MKPLLEPTEGSEELKPVEQAGIEEYLVPDYPEFTVKDGVMNLNPPPLEKRGTDGGCLGKFPNNHRLSLFCGILNASTVTQILIASLLNQKKLTVLQVQEISGMRYPSSAERYRSKDVEEQRKLINQFHPLR